MNRNKNLLQKKDKITKIFLILCITGVSLSILLETCTIAMKKLNDELMKTKNNETVRPKYSILSNIPGEINTNISLKYIHFVLCKIGYEFVNSDSDWDLMWTQNSLLYPKEVSHLTLKPHQRVNLYPGSESITNKVQLTTLTSKYLPSAFKLPNNVAAFVKYAKSNPNSVFLEKKKHMSISTLKKINDIDIFNGPSYVQEFIQKPFLVDGYKFDIGVYVVITSINPLRAYWYKGDVLLRFCMRKFYPFNRNITSSYKITSAFLTPEELPSLSYYYAILGHSMKDSFDYYLKSQGKDPSFVWEEVQKAIAEILVMKERHLVAAVKSYSIKDNFFEMMRFDFILDEDLKVYLLKVKKSPDLYSIHPSENPVFYQQLLYNLFLLTGVSQQLIVIGKNTTKSSRIITSQKHIAVFAQECRSNTCKLSCQTPEVCKLCRLCLNTAMRQRLLKAHSEHLHRGDFKRVIPPPMYKVEDPKLMENLALKLNLSARNKLQHIWYQEKCNRDVTWCT